MALKQGHFLTGRPLKALPDSSFLYADWLAEGGKRALLNRWQLCQALARHFWKRLSTEYITHIGQFTKWCHPSSYDIVIIQEDSTISTKWLLARVVKVHPGKDNLVCMATVKTSSGVRTHPATKLTVLLPSEADGENCYTFMYYLSLYLLWRPFIRSWPAVCLGSDVSVLCLHVTIILY